MPQVYVISQPPTDGKDLLEINMRAKFGVNVMAIKRNSKINISPNSDDIIEDGDTLIVVGKNDDLSRLSER